MLRCIGLLALGPALVMLAAAAPPPAIQKAFGNTIVSTYPDNRTAELWLHPSGAYDAMGRRGDRSSGHWRIKGDKLCLKQDRPATLPFFSYCTPIPSEDTWTAKAVTGERIQVRLVKGRRGAPQATPTGQAGGG
jgi:hypothetical protein